MKIVVSLLAALLLCACAASGGVELVSEKAPQIDSRQSATVAVKTDMTGRDEVVKRLQFAIEEQLLKKRVFTSVGIDPSKSDIAITATITDVTEVDRFARGMLGAMAGQAAIVADVTVVNVKTGESLGKIVARGKSSGGHAFAGTTNEALDQAAAQIADYLLRNRLL